ncbi:hypothetical protein LMJ53_15355 [Rheinheimera sp. UJ51]|uniref:hypothetical protein n=1 Tax=Rheinheimera sp. UJ51 TaxID=2892446 RepID=UPI001E4D2A74|nr:hypothetical protein [Rheinheimera sp. UJ51]MCC5453099.1 hypothetical protein [Rheinheimera sp. UJ51]
MDFHSSNIGSEHLMTFSLTWSLLPIIATILVHIAFSAAVFNDAKRLQSKHDSLAFVNSWIWSLAVLVGGVFVALAYWVIHHSTIAKH